MFGTSRLSTCSLTAVVAAEVVAWSQVLWGCELILAVSGVAYPVYPATLALLLATDVCVVRGIEEHEEGSRVYCRVTLSV